LFFLHSNIVPDSVHRSRWPDAAARMTLYQTFVDHVRPVFARLAAEGLIGAWGLTGIGHPDTIIRLVGENPAPGAVQCIANLLDSPGGLKFFDGPAKPRAVIAEARANSVGVMGIRAVQAGALTSALDRPLPPDHPETRDFARAAGFRRLAAELGTSPAALAHRYALSLGVDTLVLGVKNRAELADASSRQRPDRCRPTSSGGSTGRSPRPGSARKPAEPQPRSSTRNVRSRGSHRLLRSARSLAASSL
jgi:aryl-alcohol dehydrogenase-like predicted oxidoreductase